MVRRLTESGIVSVTFRQLSPDEIIALVNEAGLTAIEWGGDIHVPHGNLETAREVGVRTRNAGLEIASYGSYYRSVESEASGLAFESVLETALALGAPLIRIWAGRKSPKDADERYRDMIASETHRIAECASDAGIRIAYEYHPNTLTETPESTVALLDAVSHGNVFTYWQAPLNATPEQRVASLEAVLPYLANIHVFHLRIMNGETCRRPLAEGKFDWIRDLSMVSRDSRPHYALLEFVLGDDPGNFLRDAATLRKWLAHTSSQEK